MALGALYFPAVLKHFDAGMTHCARHPLGLILLFLFAAAPGARAADTNGVPDFKEVYDLVRAHLAGASEAELNRAAVEGFLARLHGKVRVVGGGGEAADTNATPLAKSTVLDDGVAYVRVGRVEAGIAEALRRACDQLSSTNKLKGLALDLRFADGDDYAAAAAAADLFVARERPLLDWGQGVVKSKEKKDALGLPVAVLVNHETGGAAEALAAVMRETGSGLLLGSATAGRAMIAQEFPLSDGQRLSVAATPVKLGDGTTLSGQGVKPDIEVRVSPEAERAYLKDAYAVLPGASQPAVAGATPTRSTNVVARATRPVPLTEAELEREHREGTNRQSGLTPPPPAEPQAPVIRDPALARAVDLLKGLAVVRESHR